MRSGLEALSLALLGLQALIIGVALGGLPDRVPVHFDVLGQADAFEPKSSLWELWAVSAGLYLLLSGLSLLPLRSPLWNLPAAMKVSGNRATVLEMMASFKVLVTFTFLLLSFFSLRAARGQETVLMTPLLLIMSTLVPLIILAVYYTKMQREAD